LVKIYNMAQRQFKSDDTSKWIEAFGSGGDGAYAPTTGTDAPIDSACSGTASTTSLTATNVSFATGQCILIHQTYGTSAGQWELNKIASYTAGTITTQYSLINTYGTGAQVLVLKQYTTALIDTGVTLTGKAWNGTVGGIVAWLAKTSTTITGTVTVVGQNAATTTGGAGIGQRGGVGEWLNGTAVGYRGDGTTGNTTQTHTGSGSGGVGAVAALPNGKADGGGGGNATAGTAGDNGAGDNAHEGGAGGLAAGNAALTLMVPGGGAGGGAAGDVNPKEAYAGGGGAGIVFFITKALTITGAINLNGGAGATGAAASGGGGAGGSGLFKVQTAVLGTNLITATAGTSGGVGGGGSVGRIHLDYLTSKTGTTNPTLDSTQDTSLIESMGGAFLLNFI